MIQSFLNKRLPWYLVAVVNFSTMMSLVWVVVTIGSNWLAWMSYDPLTVGAGSAFYAYIEFNNRKSSRFQDPN